MNRSSDSSFYHFSPWGRRHVERSRIHLKASSQKIAESIFDGFQFPGFDRGIPGVGTADARTLPLTPGRGNKEIDGYMEDKESERACDPREANWRQARARDISEACVLHAWNVQVHVGAIYSPDSHGCPCH